MATLDPQAVSAPNVLTAEQAAEGDTSATIAPLQADIPRFVPELKNLPFRWKERHLSSLRDVLLDFGGRLGVFPEYYCKLC